jgi:two-component system, LuxR family, sensor kinase FixL
MMMKQLSVRDTGGGIEIDDTERLFDAFYTTKREGMGMGLTISRSIVESHGGRLWAEANAGAGATFYVFLPIAPFIQTGGEEPVALHQPTSL